MENRPEEIEEVEKEEKEDKGVGSALLGLGLGLTGVGLFLYSVKQKIDAEENKSIGDKMIELRRKE